MANKGITILGTGGFGTGSDECSAIKANLLKFIPNTQTPCTAILNDSEDEPIQGEIIQKFKDDIKTNIEEGIGKIIVPAGYFHNDVEVEISASLGTLGRPTLYKSEVKNNSITVSAKSNVSKAGYLMAGEGLVESHTIISANELVNGNKVCRSDTVQQTNIDVTNYKTVSINPITLGTAGTPVATKSDIINNTIIITPTVTNTTGYITGNTIKGSSVVVSVNELVAGNKECSSGHKDQHDIDVTQYKTISISKIKNGNAGLPQLEIIDGTNSKLIKPYVTNEEGYILGHTIEGSQIQISASDLVVGTQIINTTDQFDVTNYQFAQVDLTNLNSNAIVEGATILGIPGRFSASTNIKFNPIPTNWISTTTISAPDINGNNHIIRTLTGELDFETNIYKLQECYGEIAPNGNNVLSNVNIRFSASGIGTARVIYLRGNYWDSWVYEIGASESSTFYINQDTGKFCLPIPQNINQTQAEDYFIDLLTSQKYKGQ